MKALLLACAAVVGLAGAASAQIYKCDLKSRGVDGGIPEFILYKYQKDRPDDIWVLDGYIKALVGGPVQGELVRDNEMFLKIKWSIPKTRSKEYGSLPRYDYTLTIHKQKGLTVPKGLAVVIGYPIGYDNHFEGHGACKPYKKK